jgi:MFS family permease
VKKTQASIYAVSGSHGIMHAYLVLLPALIPLLGGELGNYETIGLLVSAVFLLYGWGSLPVGFLADRYPKKTLVIASMAICGVSAIMVGQSRSFLLTAVFLMALGAGASLYHPPGYASMALLSLEMRGRYMGIQGMGGDMGMAVAYITSAIIGSLLGWRNTFVVWGLVGVGMAILDYYLVVEPESGGKIEQAHGGHLGRVKAMFPSEHMRLLVIVLAIIVLSGALWNGVSAFILAYINQVKNVNLVIAGGLSTISYTVGAVAQVVGGELSDKHGRRIVLLLGFGLFAASLFLLTQTPGSVLLILLLVCLLGATFYVTQAPLNALLGDISRKENVGFAYGVNFGIKYGIGSFSPAIAGFLATRYSMDHVFWFFASVSAVAFVLTLLVRDVKK